MVEIEDKIKLFSRELNRINDQDFRQKIEDIIRNIPQEFFEKPASSTGKYHPKRAVEPGGLVWHTKSAFWFAVALTKPGAVFSFLNNDERDIAFAAILLHDTMKYGFDGARSKGGYVYFNHPLMVEDLVKRSVEVDPESDLWLKIDAMVQVIRPHMGSWNTNNYEKTVLPTPKTKLEKFVHFCDYIASIEFCHFDEGSLDRFIGNL